MILHFQRGGLLFAASRTGAFALNQSFTPLKPALSSRGKNGSNAFGILFYTRPALPV